MRADDSRTSSNVNRNLTRAGGIVARAPVATRILAASDDPATSALA
jgi:hypothetical protein